MNQVVVREWYGRLGNNIIQLINAIKMGKEGEYNVVRFPHHKEFNCMEIVLSENEFPKRDDLYDEIDDNFYWKAIRERIKMDAAEFFRIFLLFIKPILIYDLGSKVHNDLCVHIRGGESKYNREYVPFPLAFVRKIPDIKDMIIVAEDINMPVAKFLYVRKEGRWRRQSVEEDLRLMTNCKRLALSYGTFSLIAVLFSIIHGHLKELYLPDYVYNRWKDHWKVDVKEILNPETRLIVVDLPNYMRIGEYIWSPTSQRLMIDYQIQ